MIKQNISRRLSLAFVSPLLLCLFLSTTFAQTNEAPLTSQELVKLVYQLPAHPEKKEEVINEVRRRGIGFALTDGLRAVVATKSGNDALLRRTLEEAERRRLNPVTHTLPAEAEGRETLEQSRTVTLAATEAMPDFLVRQQITRSAAYNGTDNWQQLDRLSLAVSYRASAGEEYKLLTVNGLPPSAEVREGGSYEQVGGTSSSGEYVSMLADIFKAETQTTFKMVDTDTLRNRRTIIYEYEVKLPYSHQSIKAKGLTERTVVTAYRGRVWIDRENYRVLRLEDISVEIPNDFPISAASSLIDYDWVTINEKQYLLPIYAEIKLTQGRGPQAIQTRNEIRFRNYQKFSTDVKIIEDVEGDDEPPPPKP